jgi:hypothetical protein
MNEMPLQPSPELQLLLLNLISPARAVTQAQVDGLGAADWKALLAMAHQHRLGPMLHWQLGRAHALLHIAAEVKADLAQSYKKAALRSLLMQRELLQVHHLLEKAGIPYVALKGAFLAYYAYPHPALRPLRDLDILVPKDKVLTAYQALLDAGCTRIEHLPGGAEASLQVAKHLPPLRSASGQVHVELHGRLFHYELDGQPQVDMSDSPGFWERVTTAVMVNHEISFESPTDLLLHMIVHAVYDHRFNNGPLLLSDLAFLLKAKKIDWPLFWHLAQQGRYTRGCLLSLKLTQRYWGVECVEWPSFTEQELSGLEASVDVAAKLMLQDSSARTDVALQVGLRKAVGPVAKIRHAWRKLFPSRLEIAANYPVKPNSWRIHYWYLVRLHHRLTLRLPEFLKARQQHRVNVAVEQGAALDGWLAVERPADAARR